MEELLKELSDLRGISGFEYRIADEIEKRFRMYTDDVHRDALGSVIACKKSSDPHALKLMIEAHMDEIGLMVKDIDENGFITFVNIGGVDPRILPAAEVIIHGTRDIPGIIGAKPPHLQSAEESKKSVKINDMAIDTGYSRDAIADIVSIGDSITLAQSAGVLANRRFSGKTLDDRAGIAVLLEVLRNIDFDPALELYFVAAVQEEVGLRGAKTAAYSIAPDAAIAIDVCHGVTPDNSENAFEIGSGTVISIGPNITPAFQKQLVDTAQRHNIRYALDVDGGDTGTDAWVIQVAREGVPTTLLSIPLKYMHTSVETIDIADAEATAALILEFIRDFGREEEGFCC